MNTDTRAVARWDRDSFDEMEEFSVGNYVLFTDHERVVGELKNRIDVYDTSQVCDKEEIAKQAILIRNKEFTIETLRTALAASRAEVEALQRVKDIVAATRRSTSHAYGHACRIGDGRAQSVCNARTSLLNNIAAAMENGNDPAEA